MKNKEKKITEILDIAKKENWREGPWQDEPDEETFNYKNYQCFIERALPGGHLCGYVVLPYDHFFRKLKSYMDIDHYISVHGGITYGRNITIRKERYYKIGFDCAHVGPGGDLCPGYEANFKKLSKILPNSWIASFDEQTYKDIDFVRNEIKAMVDQIIDVKEKNNDGK